MEKRKRRKVSWAKFGDLLNERFKSVSEYVIIWGKKENILKKFELDPLIVR